MKYGEKIEIKWFCKKTNTLSYRFRIDPVPYSGRGTTGWFYSYHRRPQTTQERRLSLAYDGYVRGKRKMSNLPHTWDDYPRSDHRTRRSWKGRCRVKKQWMKNYG